MRSISVKINDVPKIYYEDPKIDDDSVFFEHSDLPITFQLNDALSLFHTIVTT